MDIYDIENPEDLRRYLVAKRPLDAAGQLRHSVLSGGVSNKTVLVDLADGRQWVLKQALRKLRVAAEWYCDPARIHREAAGMRTLARLAPPGAATALVFEDVDQHIIAMEAVPAPHRNLRDIFLSGEVHDSHVTQLADLLAGIHRGSWARREELATEFDDRQFFEALRLEPYYAYAALREPRARPFCEHLITDCRRQRVALVHGDFSPKNVLVRADGQLVLLDHEVIHWGDPAFDVGFMLAHLLSKAHHVEASRQALKRAVVSFWQRYRAGLGDVPWAAEAAALAVRHTLGCLLARVAGRSPLDYLSEPQRIAQREAVVSLMHDVPLTVEDTMGRFVHQIEAR